MRRTVLIAATGCALSMGCSEPIGLEDASSRGSGESTAASDEGPGSSSASNSGVDSGSDTTALPTTSAEVTSGMDSSTTGDTGGDTGPVRLPDCPGIGEGSLELGEACDANDACASALCPAFGDLEPDDTAVCEYPAADCSMRVTGTVRDLLTGAPIADANVELLAILDAYGDIDQPLGMTGSGVDGRFDVLTDGPVLDEFGAIARITATGYAPTVTQISRALFRDPQSNGIANHTRDVWLLSDTALDTWSATLSLDPAIAPGMLPLVEGGGVVGLVRDTTGQPLSGYSIEQANEGPPPTLRYVQADGSFDTTQTSELGLFVLLDPPPLTTFQAWSAGRILDEAWALSKDGWIGVMVLTGEPL